MYLCPRGIDLWIGSVEQLSHSEGTIAQILNPADRTFHINGILRRNKHSVNGIRCHKERPQLGVLKPAQLQHRQRVVQMQWVHCKRSWQQQQGQWSKDCGMS